MDGYDEQHVDKITQNPSKEIVNTHFKFSVFHHCAGAYATPKEPDITIKVIRKQISHCKRSFLIVVAKEKIPPTYLGEQMKINNNDMLQFT